VRLRESGARTLHLLRVLRLELGHLRLVLGACRREHHACLLGRHGELLLHAVDDAREVRERVAQPLVRRLARLEHAAVRVALHGGERLGVRGVRGREARLRLGALARRLAAHVVEL